MAMPPEAAAQAPMPAQQEGPGKSEQGHEGGDPKQLIIETHTGLAKIAQMVAKAGAPKEVVAQLDQCVQLYRSAMEQLMGGGKAPSAGSASPEQGGNPNAVPMG